MNTTTNRSMVSMLLAAAVLGLGLAACDQQEASNDGNDADVPLQQQGAVPQNPPTVAGPSSERTPLATDEVEAAQPTTPSPSSDPQ